jgi:hypothetical protein
MEINQIGTTNSDEQRKNVRFRIIFVVSVFAALFIGFGGVGWLLMNPERTNFLDPALCYLTLTHCLAPSPHTQPSWLGMMISNGIAFSVWLAYLVAAQSFVVGRGPWRQVLGGMFAVLIPLLSFALITVVIFMSTVRFG